MPQREAELALAELTSEASMRAASARAAFITEDMCALAWRWVLVPPPLVRLQCEDRTTISPNADITPIRPAIDLVFGWQDNHWLRRLRRIGMSETIKVEMISR